VWIKIFLVFEFQFSNRLSLIRSFLSQFHSVKMAQFARPGGHLCAVGVSQTPLCATATHMKITFLRHAESLFNENSRNIELNCGLSEKGKKQASKLVGEYEYIIISPLLRTQETLYYSKIKYNEIETCDFLREHRVDPCDFLEGEKRVLETEEELDIRVGQCLDYLKDLVQRGKSNILVLSHCEFLCKIVGKGLQNAESVVMYMTSKNTLSFSSSYPSSSSF
jgi:Histidine phosphatase superfamily (branch 1)